MQSGNFMTSSLVYGAESISQLSSSVRQPEYRARARLELWKYVSNERVAALAACFDTDLKVSDILAKLNTTTSTTTTTSGQNTTSSSIGYDAKLLARLQADPQPHKLFALLVAGSQLGLDANSRKDRILIDVYYYLLKFGVSHSFGLEQLSALIITMRHTHQVAAETSFGNLAETFDYFKKHLLVYAVHRPPFSLRVFTAAQIELIVAYFLATYFHQFKLYKSIFTSAIKLHMKFKYSQLAPDELIDVDGTGGDDTPHQHTANHAAGIIEESVEVDSSAANSQQQSQHSDEESRELRQFIRGYLNDRLERMKSELMAEEAAASAAAAAAVAAKPGSADGKKSKSKPKTPNANNKKK